MKSLRGIGLALAAALLVGATALPARAQEEPEYRMEIGAAAGLGFGFTDLNNRFLGHPHASGGAVLRFVLNPRMAIKTQLAYTGLGGNTRRAQEFYPAAGADPAARLDYRFSGGVVDLGATYELHFWPYGFQAGYQGYRRLTPYVQLGLGLGYGTAKAFNLNLPVGVGVKYKLAQRLNLGLDWQMHFCLSDKLDGLEAASHVATSGFKNKDHYHTLLLTLTYSFAQKCLDCNHD